VIDFSPHLYCVSEYDLAAMFLSAFFIGYWGNILVDAFKHQKEREDDNDSQS